jgi:hypothetical protein
MVGKLRLGLSTATPIVAGLAGFCAYVSKYAFR